MHRVIMKAARGSQIDHKNGNGLDNRRSNLRFANVQQNRMNSKKQNRFSSRYKGVHYYKHARQWKAQIRYNGIQLYLGYYRVETDAAKVYDQKAKKLFGEFARLNFPEGEE